MVTSGIGAGAVSSSDGSFCWVSFMRSTVLIIILHCHVGMISVWELVGWKPQVSFLRMAQPVVEGHGESERLWLWEPAKRLRASWKGSLTSKLARFSPKGSQI
eukprot:1144183-Pelagomonas_calceolata.AAC.1